MKIHKKNIVIFASSALEVNNKENITFIDTQLNLYSEWINCLIELLINSGCIIIGAKYFNENLSLEKEYNYYLIQDRETADGIKLINNTGVKPLLIFCMESPLYARRFYLTYENYINKFAYRLLISVEQLQKFNNIYRFVTLPHIFRKSLVKDKSQPKDTDLVLISRARLGFFLGIDLSSLNISEIVKGIYCYLVSPIYRQSSNNSTAIYKIYCLFRLSRHLNTKVYGKKWNKNIFYVFRFFGCKVSYIENLGDKCTALKRSKYNLVIENTEIDYYITEKFFDSILNDCIPIVSSNLAKKINKIWGVRFVNFMNLNLFVPDFINSNLDSFLESFHYGNVANNIFTKIENELNP